MASRKRSRRKTSKSKTSTSKSSKTSTSKRKTSKSKSKGSNVDVVEACIQETILVTGISSSKVRSTIYERFPQYHPRFAALPYEVVEKIILEMNPYTLSAFCDTSQRMREMCTSERLWKAIVKKHMPRGQAGEYDQMIKEQWDKWFAKIKKGWYVFPDLRLIDYKKALLMSVGKKPWFTDRKKIQIKGLGKIEYFAWLDLDQFFKYNSKSKKLYVPAGVVTLEVVDLGLKSLILHRGLVKLDCRRNEISYLDIPDSLIKLNCKLNKINGVLDIKNVQNATLRDNQITNIKFNKFRFAERRDFYGKREKIGLEHLSASGNKFKRLDLRKSILRTVDVSDSGLEEILLPKSVGRFGTHPGLLNVRVGYNNLKILVLPHTVRILDCAGNPLERVYTYHPDMMEAREGDKLRKEIDRCISSDGIKYYKNKMPDTAKIYRERKLLELLPMGIDSLQKMPVEVVVEIMVKLGYYDIKRLCKSSRFLRSVCQNDMMWIMLLKRDFNIYKDTEYYGYKTAYALYHELIKDPKKWKTAMFGHYLGLYYVGRTPKTKEWNYIKSKDYSPTLIIPDGVVAIYRNLIPQINCKDSKEIHCLNDLRVILQGKHGARWHFKSLNELKQSIGKLKVMSGAVIELQLDEKAFKKLPKKYRTNLKVVGVSWYGPPQVTDRICISRPKPDDVRLYIPSSFFGIRETTIQE